MNLAGKKIYIYDEETGEGQEYTFTDTPLGRWTGGIIDACGTFGLSRDETYVVLVYFQLFDRKEGVLKRSLPEAASGIRELIKRGWMVRKKPGLMLLENDATIAIANAGTAALRFGPSAEGGRPN